MGLGCDVAVEAKADVTDGVEAKGKTVDDGLGGVDVEGEVVDMCTEDAKVEDVGTGAKGALESWSRNSSYSSKILNCGMSLCFCKSCCPAVSGLSFAELIGPSVARMPRMVLSLLSRLWIRSTRSAWSR